MEAHKILDAITVLFKVGEHRINLRMHLRIDK